MTDRSRMYPSASTDFRFDFILEDATQEQAELLLEAICTWADHRNCWIAGGYRRSALLPCETEQGADSPPPLAGEAGVGDRSPEVSDG